ncbi:MAG UNVERIFIED_CONTAM: hypothetical protein LVR18_36295 [Planctomycetaceae bacterium]
MQRHRRHHLDVPCPFPRRPPSGSWSFGRMTGGRGETPRPPAVNGNRFAGSGRGAGRRVHHAEGMSLEAGGVDVSSGARTNDGADARPNAEGVFRGIGPMSRHVQRRHRDVRRRARSHGDPFGVVVVWSHDRGVAAKRHDPGCRRESLRDWGVARSTMHHAEGVFVESRGCRRLVDTPDETTNATERRRRFRGIGPMSRHATSSRRSNVVPVPTATPSGSWSFGRMTGGRRNAATPGCRRESLRDWGVAAGRRVHHAEGVFVESRGCRRLVDTPGRNEQRDRTPKAFPWDRARHVRGMQRHRDIERRAVPTATPSGSWSFGSHDRGSRRNAAARLST